MNFVFDELPALVVLVCQIEVAPETAGQPLVADTGAGLPDPVIRDILPAPYIFAEEIRRNRNAHLVLGLRRGAEQHDCHAP